MQTRLLKQIFIISVIVLSACSSQGVKALSGQWQLSESNLNNILLKKEDLDSSSFTLNFDTGSKASGMTACNRWSTTYSLTVDAKDSTLLSTKPAALTRKRCHHKSDAIGTLYRQYPNALKTPAEVSQKENTLLIKWTNGDYWIFEEKVDSQL